ncbi:MAG: hypothetical protein ACE5PV_24020 [Candidatus Poribacteria bacterium]
MEKIHNNAKWMTSILSLFALLLLSIPAAEAGKMYWTSEKGIHRAELDGGNLETILPIGLLSPRSITVDAIRKKMYWTDPDTHKIQRADFNNANVEDIVETGFNAPRDIAIDLGGGKIYWTATRPFGKVVAGSIHRANLDGTERRTVIMLQDLQVPGDIAVDAGEGKIYWTMDTVLPCTGRRRNDLHLQHARADCPHVVVGEAEDRILR